VKRVPRGDGSSFPFLVKIALISRSRCVAVRYTVPAVRSFASIISPQCVAVCCSVLQCVSLCCSVLQCGSCSTLQCVAVSASGPLSHLLIHAQVAHISRYILNSHSYRWRMCVWVYTWSALKTAQSSKYNLGVCGEIHITADKIWTVKDELKVNNELKIWFVLHDTSKYEISLAWWSMYKDTDTFAYTQ